jgi:hypothetical protein
MNVQTALAHKNEELKTGFGRKPTYESTRLEPGTAKKKTRMVYE